MLSSISVARAKSLTLLVAPIVLSIAALGVMITDTPILVKAFIVFLGAIVLFALEDKLGFNKAPTALVAGVALLLLARTALPAEEFEHALFEMGGEVIQIVVFVFAAVLNAGIIVHHRAFDRLRTAIYVRQWSDLKQFTVIVLIVPLMSMILDNLTATVIGLSMALMFFTNRNNIIVTAVMIVIGANAGGAPSPVGDITTTILWVAGLYTAQQIIIYGLLPNIVMFVVPFVWFRRHVEPVENDDSKEEQVYALTRHEKIVIITAFVAFTLPVILKTTMHLPPWLSLSLGFGLTWLVAEAPNFFNRYVRVVNDFIYHGRSNGVEDVEHPTVMDINIEHKLREEVTVSEIFFFVGVLTMVSGLRLAGGLQPIADLVYGGTHPQGLQLIVGHVLMGLLSAVFDNIPLVELVKQMLEVPPGNSWVLLAATAGNGGSLLFYGSAAGVVAYGILRKAGVVFGYVDYLKKVSVPVLIGYFLMVLVWYLQYLFVGM